MYTTACEPYVSMMYYWLCYMAWDVNLYIVLSFSFRRNLCCILTMFAEIVWDISSVCADSKGSEVCRVLAERREDVLFKKSTYVKA